MVGTVIFRVTSVQSLNSLMVRSLFGIIESDEFDLMSTFPGMVFLISYFVFIVVIGLNGP